MSGAIAAIDQVTPTWLGGTLRRSGVLPRGRVVDVLAQPNAAFNSATWHLRVAYSEDAPAGAPARLILKLNGVGAMAMRDGEREVAFYRLVAPAATSLPMLLHPYDAVYDPQGGKSHLLLADLSETHVTPTDRARVLALDAVPTDPQLDGIVDAIAGFHAHWWQHPALGEGLLEMNELYGSRASFDTYVRETVASWASFIAVEGARFPVELREIYEEVLSHLPALWERHLGRRIAARRNLTLCHGDCYFNNFLCPKAPDDGATYIIDWQGPQVDFAARDLVYLFATFWTPAQRREGDRELRLLGRYHRALQARGVSEYGWDDLLLDYRLMLVLRLFLPVWDAVHGASRGYWWPKLRCLAGAFQDFGCAELVMV